LRGRIGDIVWLDGNKYYYVRFYGKEKAPDGVPPPAQRVFLRENGKEEMVFGKGLPSLHFIGLKRSLQSNKALLSIRYGWTKSDVYVGEITDPNSWSLLYGGGDFIAYPIDYVNGNYVVASFDGEGMGRLLAINERSHEVREIIGEQPYPLEEAVVYKDSIVASYLVNASTKIKLINMNGEWREISFEPPGTISSLHSNGEKCVFKYESFLIPYRIYLLENGKNENYTFRGS